MRKLLLIGPGYVHTYRFAQLVQPLFDEVMLVTDKADHGLSMPAITVDFSLRKIQNHIRTVRRIRNAIRSFRPTVIHLHQANSVAFYGLRAVGGSGIPTVLTAWGSDVLLLPDRGWLMRRMVRRNLQKATVLTADAHFMAKRMAALSGRNEADILVASFGIDLPSAIVPKEPVIYSNRLHKPLYRIREIIMAFRKFHATPEGKSWRLVIGGTGPETEALKAEVAGGGIADAVLFTGWLDAQHNAEWYARSSIFVSVPESDGTSISLLEAMSHGCLPIVSDLPANREWVKHGINGSVVTDVQQDFISEALTVDRQRAGQINRERMASETSRESCRRRFAVVYDSLQSARSQGAGRSAVHAKAATPPGAHRP